MSKFNSNFDKNTGVSYTIMRTELGNFLGIAHLQDEDKEYASTYFGCRISELKAMRDYYRTKMKRAKLEAKGMKQVRDALYTSFLTTNSEDMRKAVSITNKNYNKKLKQVEYFEQMSISLNEQIKIAVAARDEYIKKNYRSKTNKK